MLVLQIALHTLGTEPPLIEGKVLPRLEPDDFVVFHFELDSALLAAKAAVGLHHPVGLDLSVPAQRGSTVQRGAELTDEFRNFYWWFGHMLCSDFKSAAFIRFAHVYLHPITRKLKIARAEDPGQARDSQANR